VIVDDAQISSPCVALDRDRRISVGLLLCGGVTDSTALPQPT
jgi:hypothetical protein